MIALIAILLASVATWLLRVSFIGIIPVERIPARVRQALDDVAPAVMAALLATYLVRGGGPSALLSSGSVAALVAAVVAWRTSNLAATVLVGVVAYGLLGLV